MSAPLVVLAQEATPQPSPEVTTSPTPQPTPTPPEQTPTPSPQPEPNPIPSPQPSETPSSTPAPSPSQQQEATPSAVTTPQSTATTSAQINNDSVVLGQSYHASQNDKVTVTFTKLPPKPGNLTIKQITLSKEQIVQTGALSNTAYDISSDMQNGTFEYTLTLPTSKTDNVEVKASEDGKNFVTVGGVTAQTDTLTITGLNHFTVFVVVGTISSGNSTPFDESNTSVVVNEFVFNPTPGKNDWVELYNRGSSTVNLAGWKLDDNTSTMTTLSGSLPARGFVVFEVSNRLNAASPDGDTIILKDSTGNVIDRVSYKDSTTINGAANVGSVGAGNSVGRTSDGLISGAIWTK